MEFAIRIGLLPCSTACSGLIAEDRGAVEDGLHLCIVRELETASVALLLAPHDEAGAQLQWVAVDAAELGVDVVDRGLALPAFRPANPGGPPSMLNQPMVTGSRLSSAAPAVPPV